MARFLILSLMFITSQVKSQIIRSPLSAVGRSFAETILNSPRSFIENPQTYEVPRTIDIPFNSRNFLNYPSIIEASSNFIQPQPAIIGESPCIIPVPNVPNIVNTVPPSTTIITDCTPSVCQNLVDTINLLIVTNLLQKGNGEVLKAAPSLKNVMINPGFAAPLANPNLITGYASNLVTPNVIAPNCLAPNQIVPNLVSSSVYGNSFIAPGVITPSSVAAGNTIVTPNGPIDNSALLSSLLRLLGRTAL